MSLRLGTNSTFLHGDQLACSATLSAMYLYMYVLSMPKGQLFAALESRGYLYRLRAVGERSKLFKGWTRLIIDDSCKAVLIRLVLEVELELELKLNWSKWITVAS